MSVLALAFSLLNIKYLFLDFESWHHCFLASLEDLPANFECLVSLEDFMPSYHMTYYLQKDTTTFASRKWAAMGDVCLSRGWNPLTGSILSFLNCKQDHSSSFSSIALKNLEDIITNLLSVPTHNFFWTTVLLYRTIVLTAVALLLQKKKTAFKWIFHKMKNKYYFHFNAVGRGIFSFRDSFCPYILHIDFTHPDLFSSLLTNLIYT